jgi:mannan endo-1,4-beta-mannosidase
MKLIKFCINSLLAISLLTPILTSCGGEDEPEVSGSSLTVKSATNNQILVNGIYDETEVTVTFSEAVTLSTKSAITLDDAVISSDPEISGSTVTWHLNLDSESSHTLKLGRYAFRGADNAFLQEAYTYNFTTEKKPVITANFDNLSNSNASSEAVKLYNYLTSQYGKKTISGAMANVNNNNDFAGWVSAQSGAYPGLTCYDFIHLPYSGQNWIDYSDITPAKTQWQNGGIVAYMWHWVVPANEEDYRNGNYTKYSYSNTFDINAALTDGTWQNEFINKDIAKVAGYLKLLKDAGIPVLWRPLHEAAGDYANNVWFWWGKQGVDATKKLWNYLYDKLTNTYGLNNLIWVWTVQTTDSSNQLASISKLKEAYPGDSVVDILSTDTYNSTSETSNIDEYKLLWQLGGGKKLVALGETGLVQNFDKCYSDGAYWAYFMIWYTNDIHKTSDTVDGFGNKAAWLKSVFSNSHVLNRNELSYK